MPSAVVYDEQFEVLAVYRNSASISHRGIKDKKKHKISKMCSLRTAVFLFSYRLVRIASYRHDGGILSLLGSFRCPIVDALATVP